jgi:glyoxylate reductase
MAATRPRIYATCDIGKEALDVLRNKSYDLEVYSSIEPPPKSTIIQKVKTGVDALITTLRDPIDEEVFAAGSGTLKIVAQDAVGFNNIDRAAANKYKIPFSNTADVLTDATAEFAFFIMGCVARKLYPSERLVEEGRWPSWHPYEPFLGDEVTGRTVAVIGTGRIGKSFIKKAVGFDMDVLCYDSEYQDHKFVETVQRAMDARFEQKFVSKKQTIRYVSFEEALKNADYVTLHVPLIMPNESPNPTFHFMSEAQFKMMKPTAYVINTSRGPIVDEKALHKALLEGWIAGAALDVFEVEPLPADSPLRDPRLHLKLRKFHHFASGARQTRLSPDPNLGMAGRTVQAVLDMLEGNYGGDPKQMPYIVNKEAF